MLASITSHSAPEMIVPTDCPAIPRRSASFSPGEAAPASGSAIDVAASASRRSDSPYGLIGVKGDPPDVSAGTTLKTLLPAHSSEPSAFDAISPDLCGLVTPSSSFSAVPHVQSRRLELPPQTATDFCTNSTRTSISFTHDGQRPQADMMLLSRRGQTLPEGLIPHSDVSALHHPPPRSSSQLSAFHTIQQASSASRRASLANLLHRMSTSTQPPSDTASTHFSDAASELSLAASSDSAPALDSVGRLLSRNVSAQLPPPSRRLGRHTMVLQPQVASEQLPRVAAGSVPVTPNNSPMLSGSTAISVSLGRRPSLFLTNDALQASSGASQQGHMRPLKRTISDVALEALESVESLKCPIIEYSHLDIKRKIGAGSIGQVCTLLSGRFCLLFVCSTYLGSGVSVCSDCSVNTAHVLDSDEYQISATCMVCSLTQVASSPSQRSHHLDTHLPRPCM